MRRIDRLWRVAATGLSFSLFGLGGLAISSTIFPVLHLTTTDRQRAYRRCRYVIHLSFKVFVRIMRELGVISYEMEDVDRLKRVNGSIIIANHPSLIDVVFIGSLVPNTCCVVKKAAWSNPFFWGVVTATGYIQNDEPEILIDACIKSLEAGNNLVIFPEGTRTVVGQPMRLRRGAATVIARSGKPFVPLIITCNPPMLTKAEKWYQIPPRKGHFRISVGETIEWQSLVAQSASISLVNRRLTRSIQDIFEQGIMRHEQLG